MVVCNTNFPDSEKNYITVFQYSCNPTDLSLRTIAERILGLSLDVDKMTTPCTYIHTRYL